jgi:hypothetical protein
VSAPFRLVLSRSNAAFEDGEDVSQLLRKVADELERTSATKGVVFDANGVSVGSWSVEEPVRRFNVWAGSSLEAAGVPYERAERLVKTLDDVYPDRECRIVESDSQAAWLA